jgi:16S rRNA (cytosine967-C5)-methyltransferase
MTPSARIEAAIQLCQLVIDTPNIPADKIINRYFRSHRYIGAKDRRVIAKTCYDALRFAPRYERLASIGDVSAGGCINSRFLILLILKHEDKHSMDDIYHLFSGDSYAPASLTNFEIDLLKKEINLSPAENLCIPIELYGVFEASMNNAELRAFYESNVMEGNLDVRVNTLKSNRDKVLKQLIREGYLVESTPYSPLGIRFLKREALEGHPLCQEGVVEFQDEGSQLLALVCDAKPSMTVLDYCAGAGGKTLALSACMENKGQLFACDIHDWRLKRARERARKAAAHNIRYYLADDPKFLKRHLNFFDRVLVDAPCSGTGTWRRNPDLKIRTTLQDVVELQAVQRSILEKTAPLVKKGGRLIYATCSVLKSENQDQMAWFLETHTDFEMVAYEVENDETDMPDRLYAELLQRSGATGALGVNLATHQFGTDGFYVCILRRKNLA